MVTLAGSSAIETLTGSTGDDSLLGAISDTFIGLAGNDSLLAITGNNVFFGNTGNDTLTGANLSDTLFGGQDDDLLFGFSGGDSLSGDLGDDSLVSNTGDDTVLGGSGADTIRGGQDNDQIFGNAGEDTVLGDLGDDTVRGGKDNDSVNGGAGNDVLYGDLGVDTMTGGSGNDTFTVVEDDDTDVITDFTQGEDIIDLSNTDATEFDDITIEGGLIGSTITGAGFSLVVSFVPPDDLTSFDFIFSSGLGNGDSFTLTSGADSFAGGEDDDTFITDNVNFTSADTLAGGAGGDTILGEDALTVVDADFTNVTDVEAIQLGNFSGQSIELGNLASAAGINQLAGGVVLSDVVVNASGWTVVSTNHPLISLGVGNDSITTGAANDTIMASSGEDTINVMAGSGNDSIDLGSDTDTDVVMFDESSAVTTNTSVIENFNVGEDDLDYNGTALDNGAGTDGFESVTSVGDDMSNATIIAVNITGQTATDSTEAQAVINTLDAGGFSADADDVVLFVINDGSGNSGLWLWNDTSGDGGNGDGNVDADEVGHVFDFTGVVAGDFLDGDFI